MRALVLDGAKAVRMIRGRMRGPLGFEVWGAADGVEGLEELKKVGTVDLILVDWNMPRMNGLEFVKAVRADSGNDSARIMMVTTETEVQNVAQALEAGANEYVMKPFTKDVVIEKLGILGIAAGS